MVMNTWAKMRRVGVKVEDNYSDEIEVDYKTD